MVARRVILAGLAVVSGLLLVGCGTMRLFQAKVPPPLAKEAPQVEAERRAADLIAREIQTPVELKPVAEGLSSSLGKPQKPLTSATPAELTKAAATSNGELQVGLAKMQKQIEVLNKQLIRYQGREIEGTGFDIAGPGMMVVVIGLVVLAVACPPVMTLMFFAFRRLKAAAGIVVNEVEAAAKSPEAKEAVAGIKERIAQKMQAHPQKTVLLKSVITNLKQ